MYSIDSDGDLDFDTPLYIYPNGIDYVVFVGSNFPVSDLNKNSKAIALQVHETQCSQLPSVPTYYGCYNTTYSVGQPM